MNNLFVILAAAALVVPGIAAATEDGPSDIIRIVRVSMQADESAASAPAASQKGSPRLTESPAHASAVAQVLSSKPGQVRRRPSRPIAYSDNQLVIVGLDARNQERTRFTITDPRLIRLEKWHSDDGLTAGRFYRANVEFTVAIVDPEVVNIRIEQPNWDGSDWQLNTIAEAPIQ